MGHSQEDVERSSRQSENSGRSSFHLFVCSQAMFAPVKTKFNLHPFIHCYSLLSASASPQPKPLSSSLLPSHLFLPFPHSYPPAFRLFHHILEMCKKISFNFTLQAQGYGFSDLEVRILSTFHCVITSRNIGKRMSSASHRLMCSVADRFGVAAGHRWKE